ncbi:SRPBCC family protein [Mycolicibacterium wolinskyi]|uniref:SRPBCC family protein n=1 Tax=Mycolicibacterium TaxID=1866885 RepID=UPI0013FD14E7|nr:MULTISPECIES: SRPBCC family protein [Mycolicibacterium]MCV7287853.1 SRPBCC family protein [Mycolicibacterium wolinskyi]MCV7294751.1 SRPBCC family protein [Mycolicibacterium goodii]
MTLDVSTSSSSFIGRPPAVVFDFVTRPRNWVGTHPVTEDVRFSGGDARATTGDEFVETIGGGGQPGFDVRWRVTVHEIDRLWVIETDALGDPDVSCRIQYEFEPDGTGTMFRRHMTISYPAAESTGRAYRVPPKGASDPDVHDRYIETVKRRLESP